jgi:hypothetical protein
MTPHELLAKHNINLDSTAPGRSYTTCPQCSKDRRGPGHKHAKVLGVTIERDGSVRWGCNHCNWTGPEKGSGNGHDRQELPATYDYLNADGELQFQKVRNTPGRLPRFWCRRPDGRGGWINNTKGIDDKPLYRWPEVLEALAQDREIAIVEGEKDADNLWRIGIAATCNFDGAADVTKSPNAQPKWKPEYSEQLRGARLVVFNDNDPQGYAHADAVCRMSLGIAARVRRLDLAKSWPEIGKGQDVSNWLDAGHTREQLDALIDQAPDWKARTEGDADSGPGPTETLTHVDADKVEIRAIEWLWPERFALGKIGLVVGLPDEGKGQILSDIAARVSNGDDWPLGEGTAPQGNIVLLTAEDALADTVIPRLRGAGADLSRIKIIQMVKKRGSDDRMFSLITDLALLRRKVEEIGNVVLILIDPITAYLGVGKIDSFRTTDVRAVMAPLVDFASELGAAVIGVMHFNKKVDVTNALLRISDSLAFGAVARHVWAAIDDSANQRKLFTKGKNNLARGDIKSLSYGFGLCKVGKDPVSGKPIEAPHIIWLGHVDVSASEAMQAANENKSPGAKDAAKQFLLDYLADAPMPQKDVIDAAGANLITERTLRRAKDDLKRVVAKRDGPKGEWRWHLLPAA